MKYIPQMHWEQKSKYFLKKTNLRQRLYRKQLLHIVKNQIDKHQPKRLLEVGVGPGRLFPTYKGISEVHGIDFSHGMILRAMRTAEMIDIKVNLHVMSASCMTFLDNDFDMVICSNVLQHIPPELIKECCKEITRVCRGVVVIIEYYEKKPKLISDFCFMYDYPKKFNDLNLIENSRIWFERQRLFVFEKGD